MADPTNVKGLLGLDYNREAMIQQATGLDKYAAERAQGARVGAAGGALLGGIVGGFTQKQAGEGFFDAAARIGGKLHKDYEDKLVAQGLGISTEELREREKLRAKINAFQAKSSDPLEAQIETLTHAMGATTNPEIKARIADQVAVLRRQSKELAKMDRDATQEEFEQNVRSLGEKINITVDGKVMSARIDPMTGNAITDEGMIPLGPAYARGDITKVNQTDPTHKKLRAAMTPTEMRSFREGLDGSRQALRMYGRTLANVQDSVNADGGAAFLGKPTQVVATLADQWTRHIGNMARMAGMEDLFVDGVEEKYRGTRGQQRYLRDLTTRAGSESSAFSNLIPLPEGIRRGSAASQKYRSNIIQLAYMEARQREPSNRGLSDNDIENALRALDSESANPQVILRNFSEKVIMQAQAFNDRLESLPSIEGETQDSIASAIMGETAWRSYQQEYKDFQDRFGFTAGDFGRATFAAPVDADVSPGEGALPPQAPAGAGQDVDPEVLDLLSQ